jgi:RNA polymerase sigma factor for flagellar operon FliA
METNVKAIELKDLWRRYKGTGDPHARERIVMAYAPLVKYVAGRMASGLPAHVDEADLISYGLVGLISAIERFDLEREIKFETYAITRIKGAIIDELRSLDWVPRSVRARARQIERANQKLEHDLQRAPTDEEMAAELEITVDEFQESLLQISNSTIAALDELWSVSDASGDQVSLLDTLTDENAPDPAAVMDQTELKDRVADAIARLPEREKLVVALYYYENLTPRPCCACAHGCSPTRTDSAGARLARPASWKRVEPEGRPGLDSRVQFPARGENSRMHQPADRIRNVALVGHRGTGKTSLFEALLFQAGATQRLGSVVCRSTRA